MGCAYLCCGSTCFCCYAGGIFIDLPWKKQGLENKKCKIKNKKSESKEKNLLVIIFPPLNCNSQLYLLII